MTRARWRILGGTITALALTVIMGCETMPERDRLVETAEQAVSRGDWDAAMDPVLGSLHLKKDHKRSIELLQTIAPHYYQYHTASAERARAVPDFTQTFYHLDRIREASDKISLLELVDSRSGEPLIATAPDISDEYASIQREAATQYYLDAFDYLDDHNHKQAAIHFRRADEVLPGYEDSRQQYSSARQQAMQRVLVTAGGNTDAYAAVARNLVDKFTEMSSAAEFQQEALEFVEFLFPQRGAAGNVPQSVSGRDAALQHARNTGADYLLHFQIIRATASEQPVQSDRRVADCLYPNPIAARILGVEPRQVRATVIFYSQTNRVDIQSSIELVSTSDQRVVANSFANAFAQDSYEWARYSGDADALNCLSGMNASELVQKPEGRARTLGELLAEGNDKLIAHYRAPLGDTLSSL